VPRFRAALLVPALLAPLLAAGCSSSGGSTAPTTTPPSNSSASPAQAAQLAAKMRAGLAGITSAHLSVDGGVLIGTVTGDFSYANGTATASDISLVTGGQKSQIVTIGSTSYVQLPPAHITDGKPWAVVRSNSKNEFVREVASTLTLTKAASSLPAVADLVSTAVSVQDKGTTSTGHEYTVVIDPAKSGGTTLGTLLSDVGQQSVPIDLFLDGTGRPVRVVVAVKLGSQPFDITVDVSKFNAPVHVAAPPSDQVSTD
jgi:hypothetical protein